MEQACSRRPGNPCSVGHRCIQRARAQCEGKSVSANRPGAPITHASSACSSSICAPQPLVGVALQIELGPTGEPFPSGPSIGPFVHAASNALEHAFGRPPVHIGSGAAVPAMNLLHRVSGGAETFAWGAQDLELANIHGDDESVDPVELQRNAARAGSARARTRRGTVVVAVIFGAKGLKHVAVRVNGGGASGVSVGRPHYRVEAHPPDDG